MSEYVESQHMKSPCTYLRMLYHGERGPWAEASRPGGGGSSVSLRESTTLVRVQRKEKIVGRDCDHTKSTDDEQHQPEIAPEQIQ